MTIVASATFTTNADGTAVCRHRDLSVCPSCATDERIVAVHGAHYLIDDPDERTILRNLADESDDIIARRPDIVPVSVEDRGKALVRFAELAILNDLPEGALPPVVRSLSAPHPDVMTRFEHLVEAVLANERFCADPDEWSTSHDRPVSSAPEIHDELLRDIDDATWNLLHPAPACAVCKRTRQPGGWNCAQWPASRNCGEHR